MATDRNRVRAVIAVAVVSIGVAGTGLYAYLSWRTAHQPLSMGGTMALSSPAGGPGAPTGAAARPAAPTIEASADRLAQRLKQKGGSGEDWALLARSYVQMGRYPEAVEAFSAALEKMPGNTAFVAEQAAARTAGGAAR